MPVSFQLSETGVGLPLVDRPEVRNALDRAAMAEFAAAVEAAHARPELRAWIVTGAGGAFAAGGDLKARAAQPPGVAQAIKRLLCGGLSLAPATAAAGEAAGFPPLRAAEARLPAAQRFLRKERA